MRIGLALDLGTEPAAGTVSAQVRGAAALLRAAEQAGFDSVWLGESYHSRPEPFHLPSALLVLAHLAPLTSLRLGTGVLLARAQHADRLALDAALVDQLSEGRLTVGIGLGGNGLRGTLGGADAPGGRMLDAMLARLHELWCDPELVPGPYRTGGPPVWIGGSEPAGAARAARHGDGYYAATNYADRLVARQAAAYRAAGGTGDVAVNRLCLVHPDGATAREHADRYLGRVRGSYRGRAAWDMGREAGDSEPTLVGDPAEVRDALLRYQGAGVTQVQVRVAPLGVPADVALRTVETLGEQILPSLRHETTGTAGTH